MTHAYTAAVLLPDKHSAHDMEDEQLREMLLDLCAAAVDETVVGFAHDFERIQYLGNKL